MRHQTGVISYSAQHATPLSKTKPPAGVDLLGKTSLKSKHALR